MDQIKIQEMFYAKEKEKIDCQPNEISEDNESFEQSVESSDLSVRTMNVLLNNLSSIQEIIEIDEKRLIGFKNCGRRTVREVFEFKKKLSEEFGYILPESVQPESVQKKEIPDFTLLPDAIKEDVQFYESVKQELSKRSQNVITDNEIDSLEKFMALTHKTLFQFRNCGRKTAAEIKEYQKRIYEIAQNTGEQQSQYTLPSNSILSETENHSELSIDNRSVDLDAPFPSLERWVSDIARKFSQKSEQAQKAFMLRMGMLGKPPMTLEQIGEEIGGVTRERVRQITNQMGKAGKHQIRKKRLEPFIKKALEIINSRGGRIKNTTLVSLLLAHGPNGEMLKFATPFIDFLSTLREWKNAGLKIDEDGVIFTEQSDEIVRQLMSVATDIAKQNADEIIDDDLWSIEYDFLKMLLLNWFNMEHPNRKVSELSNIAVEEALLQCQSQITRKGNRIYSYKLWAFRYGSLFKASEAVLKKSKSAMHFSEIYNELTRYRPSDDLFTERNVHATLDRNKNVFLWERGFFIHKACVSIPHELINDIEKWMLKRLREDVPFIAIYGTFQIFEQRCLGSNIPNEVALYSVLKELSHPLIAYPRIPYIYLNNGKIERIPASLAVEQFLQDAERAVPYDGIKSFVIDKLFLKDLQFNQMISLIPNTIRTQNKEFLHTDFLSFDDKKFEEIVAYTRNIISSEEHVSVSKIFKDKRITCKMFGIDDAMGLFSLFKIKVDDEFDLQYPQIRRIPEEDFNKRRGLTNEVISFIKEKMKVCSYQELQEIFVDKLGYSEDTLRYIFYQKYVCKYLKDCYVHKDTLEWNDIKQEQIEKIAFDRYNECVKAGRYYGLVKDVIEFDKLPDLGEGIYWTPYLLADLLINRDNFKILGSEKNAFVPIPNQFGIEDFEDLVYEILKNEHEGGANLNSFANYLKGLEIIRRNITESMLGKSEKVKIIENEIILKELLNDA